MARVYPAAEIVKKENTACAHLFRPAGRARTRLQSLRLRVSATRLRGDLRIPPEYGV